MSTEQLNIRTKLIWAFNILCKTTKEEIIKYLLQIQ
jgi:hypothetical protein